MTPLTGYSNTITLNDTYPIQAATLESNRRGAAKITLTKVGGYDGTVAIQQRAKGSQQAYQAANYEKPPGAAVAAAAFAPDALLKVDIGGMETAIVTAGRTIGSLVIDVAVEEQD